MFRELDTPTRSCPTRLWDLGPYWAPRNIGPIVPIRPTEQSTHDTSTLHKQIMPLLNAGALFHGH